MSDIVVSSRVRLARNYEDLPFLCRMTAEQSEQCVRRTLDALRALPCHGAVLGPLRLPLPDGRGRRGGVRGEGCRLFQVCSRFVKGKSK